MAATDTACCCYVAPTTWGRGAIGPGSRSAGPIFIDALWRFKSKHELGEERGQTMRGDVVFHLLSCSNPLLTCRELLSTLLILQQHGEELDGGERVGMLVAERLAPPLQRLSQQRLCGGEIAILTTGRVPV
eukprot:scaffold90512_cov72-Phaeocystis_antarctica.AAC.3